ncbi:MAG: GxxExxY protein [Candidatus Scalindua sp.]
MTENEIGKVVVNAAIAIHKALGSGVYEIVYEVVLTHELKKHDLNVEKTGSRINRV